MLSCIQQKAIVCHLERVKGKYLTSLPKFYIFQDLKVAVKEN